MRILILHGWGLSGKNYQGLVGELKKRGHQVFAPDLPGFGRSISPKKPLKLTDYVNFVLKKTQKKGWKHFTLIGHSFGGRVGIKLAAEYPEAVDKLVLTGVPGVRGSSFNIFLFKILAKIGGGVMKILGVRRLTQLLRKILYRLAKASDYLKVKGVMRETFKKIINEDLAAAMEKVSCPTWLVWGEKDRLTPLFIAKKMEKKIKEARLIVIKRGTHGLPYKNPQLFLKTLEAIGLL